METDDALISLQKQGKPLEVISGKDWSDLEDSDVRNRVNENYNAWFKSYYTFPEGDKHSPFNLGIYYQKSKGTLMSSQYVGIMPLLKSDEPIQNEREYIVIRPRFEASVMSMIKCILKNDDFYDNSDAIKVKDITISDLIEFPSQFNKKDEKILFGLVKGLHGLPIDIRNKLQNHIENHTTLRDILTIFEVMDFVIKARTVCQKMLKHQSVKTEDNLTGKIKGRIDLQKQIKKNLVYARLDKTFCVYSKLSIDNMENRIFKYALYLSEIYLRENFNESNFIKEHIAYCKRVLMPVKFTKCTLADFRGIKSNGVFKHYKPALEAAKKVIKRISISFKGNASQEAIISSIVQPFFIDMNLLFELYCRSLFRESLTSGQMTLAKYGQKYPVINGNEKLTGFSDYLVPDIVIEKNGTPLAVIDAKYSTLNYDNRERTHQILAYMLLLNCKIGGFISPIDAAKDAKVSERRTRLPDVFAVHIGIDISKDNQSESINNIKNWIANK